MRCVALLPDEFANYIVRPRVTRAHTHTRARARAYAHTHTHAHFLGVSTPTTGTATKLSYYIHTFFRFQPLTTFAPVAGCTQ